MRKLLALAALTCASAACQPQATSTTAATVAAARPARPAQAAPPLPALFSAADTLTRPMRKLVEQIDLSKLWQSDTKERREHPVLEGFFGPDHYRFMMVFKQVSRDKVQPEVYHVSGKCHYRQNIRPFTGTLTLRRLEDADVFYSPSDNILSPAYAAGSADADSMSERLSRAMAQLHFYSAWARLQLLEEAAENSGLFEGEAVLNFYVAPRHQVGYASAPALTAGEPARGSGLLLRGARRNTTTQQVKKFVVADDVFAAAPDVYKDFGVGDRGFEINPKYAKLGWNKAWANEEWWADSPKPSLNL